MSLHTLWYYLTSYSNALTALAGIVGVVVAFLGVVVAAVYAGLTWRLAKVARTQAEQGKILAESAKRQADAALEQAAASHRAAQAAAEQAHVTRQMFEASHRPYLEVQIEQRSFYLRPDFFGLFLSVKNHGPVPAILLGWRAHIQTAERLTVHQQPPTDEGLCVFPGNTAELSCTGDGTGRMDEGPHPESDIYVEVPYRGFHREVRHETKIGATGKFRLWRMLYEDVT